MAAVLTGWAAGASALSPGAPEAGSGPAVVPLGADVGEFFAGHMQGGATLVLVDGAGAPLRRLGARFLFTAPAPGLALRVEGAGDWSITLDRRVPVAAQIAPAPAPLSPAVARAQAALAAGGDVDAVWQALSARGAPLVEDGGDRAVLTFMQRGARRGVRLFSAPSGDHDELARLGGSDIWFASYAAPWDTRMSYRLAPDVPDLPGTARERRVAVLATAQADPLNAHPWPADAPDAFNAWSTVTLRDAPVQPGFGKRPAARGTLHTAAFASPSLGNTRDVAFYTPAGFDPADPQNVLMLMFDGEHWLGKAETPRVLDALIAAGDLPKVAAVFISPIDQRARGRELPGDPAFTDAMADEILPLALAHFAMAPDPARTVLAGASYGGLAAAYGALRRPDAFGAALALSGSFWRAPEGMAADRLFIPELALSMPRRDVRFFLSAGLFEGAHGGARGILETTRHLRDVLRAKGYDVASREYAAGHDYLAWRGALGDGLLALFAARP